MLQSLILALAVAAPVPDDPVPEARAACRADAKARPRIDGIVVETKQAEGDGLPYLRIADTKSGGRMDAHFDPASERAARSYAACLGVQIRLLSRETGEVRPDARWASVVFTTDPNYIPPRETGVTHWTIPVAAAGTLTAAAHKRLMLVIPHEQVHAFQHRAGNRSPRWFHEGHAMWVGNTVSAVIAPAEAAASAADYAAKLNAAARPLDLRGWGGVKIRQEAILRQVSADDRARMKADPAYVPKGPFSFGPDDMVSDESNSEARYQASLRVFEDLEAKNGAAAVRNWAAAVTAAPGKIGTDDVVERATTMLHEDISVRLD